MSQAVTIAEIIVGETAYTPIRSNYIVMVRPLISVRWHANQRATTPTSIRSKRVWMVISICRNNPGTDRSPRPYSTLPPFPFR